MEKTYIANYTDKSTGSSWDLFIRANNYKSAVKEARYHTRGLMANCTLSGVHVQR